MLYEGAGKVTIINDCLMLNDLEQSFKSNTVQQQT